MKEKIFGKFERDDQKPGFTLVTPTTMKYVEADGSDLRVKRVRIFTPDGTLEHTYLRDELGQRFSDMPEYPDDLQHYQKITGENPNFSIK